MAISQTHKAYPGCDLNSNEGFWITGRSYHHCETQLETYHKEHPEKWIYFCDCGIQDGDYTFEVTISDFGSHRMMFTELYAEGSNHQYEQVDTETQSKFITSMMMLGSM